MGSNSGYNSLRLHHKISVLCLRKCLEILLKGKSKGTWFEKFWTKKKNWTARHLWRETIIPRKKHHMSLIVIQSSETIKYLFSNFALYDPNTPFKHLHLFTSLQLPLPCKAFCFKMTKKKKDMHKYITVIMMMTTQQTKYVVYILI